MRSLLLYLLITVSSIAFAAPEVPKGVVEAEAKYSATVIPYRKTHPDKLGYIINGRKVDGSGLKRILVRLHRNSAKTPIVIRATKDTLQKDIKEVMDNASKIGLLKISTSITPVVELTPEGQIKVSKEEEEEIKSAAGKLLLELGAEKYAVRQEAERKLKEFPPSAKQIFRAHLKEMEDPEIIIRLTKVIDHVEPSLPPLLKKDLAAVIIPELTFRQATLQDVATFLSQSTGIRISTQGGQNVNRLITFNARQISLLEALKIITEIADSTFQIKGDNVLIQNRNRLGEILHGDPFDDDPFAKMNGF